MSFSNYLLMTLLTIAIFVADLLTPLGVAMGVAYVVVVLLSLRSSNRRTTIIAMIVCSILVVLGFGKITYAAEFSLPRALANRVLSLLAITVTGVMSLRQKELLAQQGADRWLRHVVDSLPIGMVMIGREGKLSLVNQAMLRMFGYDESELIGQPIERLVPERFRANHPSLRAGFFADPLPRAMGAGRDLFGLRKDGQEFPVELGLNPVHTEDGLMVLASVLDITQRKQAEVELREFATDLERSNKDLDEFAYVASHDLRSPLAAIKDLAKWVQEDNQDSLPEKSRKHLSQMLQRVGRLERLLEDLLQYSRAGRRHWHIERVDTNNMVREIVTLLNPPRPITVTVASGMPNFATARTPLEMVFRNLIGNAIKHRERDELQIEVQCRANGQFYEFVVRDNGSGIDPQFHAQIFKLFETLRPRDEVEASGMGLAIIKRTVESYGGTVSVESAVGHGATFRFTWPISIETASKSDASPERQMS